MKARFFVGGIYLWPFNIHARPCLRENAPELVKLIRIMVPDVSEVSGSCVVK